MGTFTDDDLLHLLGEAASSFAVPVDGAALAVDVSTVLPLHRRRWVQLSSAAAAAVVAVVLGVSVFGGDDVDRVGQLAGAAPKPTFQVESGRVPLSAPQSKELTYGKMTSGTPAAGAEASAGDTGASRSDAVRGPAPLAPAPATGPESAPRGAVPTDGARVVKKGSIALVVDDGAVPPTLTRVQGLAAAAGGDVATSTTAETGPTPSGSVTLRVPVDAFDRVVEQVRGLPGEVRTATTTGQDVTAQYADLEAQLRSLKAARERFLVLLGKANSVGEILSVQQRVDDVTGRIDRLEGQRRVLADQSDLATLQVTVTEADDPVAQQVAPDTGLSKAFSDAGTGFTTGVEALVRLSGRGLLVLLLLALSAAVLRLGWRLARRRLL